MTSKNLFFKLMKENTKQRLWSVALITLLFFFLFPVQAALNASYTLDPERWATQKDAALALLLAKTELGSFFMKWCSIQNGWLVFLMFFFAVLCGISGFSYLHSKKKTDFYHSLPVRRELLFAVRYVNGILYVAVPYLVLMLIAAGILSAQGAVGLSVPQMLFGYLHHMTAYLLLYSTVILAVMMTGNVLVSLLGTAVFFGWGPCVVVLTQGYCQMYYMTFYDNSDVFLDWCVRLSPAAFYIQAAIGEEASQMLWKGLPVSAVITAAAVWLYRKRPSEAAGHAMAFAVSKPVIKLLLVVPSALLGSLLFQSILERDSWSVFGLLCGLLLSGCVIEIIYQFDFRKLFSHKRELGICALVSAALLAFFRFDFSGYDSYLPSPERLKGAGIYCSALDADALSQYHVKPNAVRNDNGEYQYVRWEFKQSGALAAEMSLEDPAALLALAKEGVTETLENRSGRFSKRAAQNKIRQAEAGEKEEPYQGQVIVAYQLESGKMRYRRYDMDLHNVKEQLDQIYDQNRYKAAMYPVLSYQAEEIAGINYKEAGSCSHVMLAGEEQKKELLETYQKELAALRAEDRRTDNPVAAIQFKTNGLQSLIEEAREAKRDYTVFNDFFYYPVYASFTETIRLLSECGTEVGSVLSPDTVEKLVLRYRGNTPAELKRQSGTELKAPKLRAGSVGEALWKEGQQDQDSFYEQTRSSSGRKELSLTITDKAQIADILQASVCEDLGIGNELNERYRGIAIEAWVPNEEAGEQMDWEAEAVITDSDAFYDLYSLYFDLDQIPEFVKQEFGLTEELMAHQIWKTY